MGHQPLRRQRLPIGLLLVATVCSGGGSGNTFAADIWASGELAVGRSNNIGRSAAGSEQSTFASLGVDITAAQRTSRLDGVLYANLAYQHYDQAGVSSEILGSITGNLVATVVPDRMTWVVDENFGQARPNNFQAASPENREFINYFSTGPDFYFHVGTQNNIVLGVRGARVDFQDSLTDTNRWIASAAFVHNVSSSQRWSVNAQTQHIDFDFSAIEDFDIDQAYARYVQTGGRTTLSVDAGINGARSPSRSYHGPLARLDVRRRITERISLLLAVGHEMTDTAGVLRSAQSTLGLSRDTPLPVNSQPYKQTYGEMGVQATGRSTQATLSVSSSRDSFDPTANGVDRQRIGLDTGLTRWFGSRINVNVAASHFSDDLRQVDADATETSARATVGWRLGRMSQIQLTGEKFRRRSDLVGGDSSENRIWLSFRMGNSAAGRRSLMGENVAAANAADPR